MPSFPNKLKEKLNERRAQNTLRILQDYEGFVDFYSNDYLGLSEIELPKLNLEKHGSTGSRLISGNSNFIEQVEAELALFFGYNSGLIFNSGYDANLGIFSALPQRDDTVLYDQLCHASIRDGLRLGLGKSIGFKHNDLVDLEDKLNRANGVIYVVVESVYSMDGDRGKLKEIAVLCQKFNALLIVDEAHGVGVIGPEGKGLTADLKLDDSIFIKLVTMGKAYGCHGAIVLCDHLTREYLLNFSRSFIYTTALPPKSIKRIRESVFYCGINAIDLQTRLKEIINYFINSCKRENISIVENQGPIQIVKANRDKLLAIEKNANHQNLAIKVVFHPTVPLGEERIRVCLHTFNTPPEIDKLIAALK